MAASTQTCAVIMAPADQEWWWYWGYTGEQVGQLLAQNKARLTDISPYIDVDGTLKFAVIMAPANHGGGGGGARPASRCNSCWRRTRPG